jgi:hypothetical protein
VLLADYRNAVRDILHDDNANFYSVAKVDRWINKGRAKTAEKGRCIRRLTTGAGNVASITATATGAGYTTATVAISAPDYPGLGTVQATATANLSAGAVIGYTMTNVGAGYVAPPTVTITGDGTGAVGTAVLSAHTTTVPNQEVYQLATIASQLSTGEPGLGSILGIQSVSAAWGSLKPTLAKRDFSWFQAYLRSVAMTRVGDPEAWCQYGQGVTGSLYLWPVPNLYRALEVDCYFGVVDLSGAQTVDLIPTPWDACVPFYAAYLAYMNAQRLDDARTMLGEFERMLAEARGIVTPDAIPDPYGE